MPTFDMTMLAEQSGFTGPVRVSEGLICDSMFATQSCIDAFGVRPVERLELLLKDVAAQLARYPAGTQAAKLTYYRVPPSGSENGPLALEIEAIVIQHDHEQGGYQLLAQIDELCHMAVLTAAA